MSNPDNEKHKTERAYIWAFAFGVVAIIAIVAGSIVHVMTTTSRAAIEAGLVQDALPGMEGVYWVEPSGDCKAADENGANHADH